MKAFQDGCGPWGQAIINRDRSALSPSYTREYPLVVNRAQGSEIWDVDGRRYIDFMAGVAVMNVGHRHPQVVQRTQEQLDKFWHVCLSDFYYPQAVELAEKLQEIAPMEDTLVYFGNSGTEAVEAAIKLAMQETRRTKFIGFLGGFHGRTLGSLGFTASKRVQQEGYLPGARVFHVPFPDPYRPLLHFTIGDIGQAVIDYIEGELFRTALSPLDVAAILVEPIQGEGGFIVPQTGFFPRLRELCDRYGIILIVDEIQSGVGRTGRWWAIEHEDVEPDIVCFAKGIASGMPIGGIVARKDVMRWDRGSHGSTFGGNPVAAAAALATLQVIEDEGLLEQASQSGKYLLEALTDMQERHPSIGDVRGRGMMIGIEFVRDKYSKERAPDISKATVRNAFREGLLLLPCGVSTVRMVPALNTPRALLDEGLALFEEALTKAEAVHLKAVPAL